MLHRELHPVSPGGYPPTYWTILRGDTYVTEANLKSNYLQNLFSKFYDEIILCDGMQMSKHGVTFIGLSNMTFCSILYLKMHWNKKYRDL